MLLLKKCKLLYKNNNFTVNMETNYKMSRFKTKVLTKNAVLDKQHLDAE